MESLEQEWAELCSRCPEATPFQSPAWLIPWWKHFGNGNLWLLTFRNNGKLLGLAPFFVNSKQVLLLGAGVSDYLDILLDPLARQEFISSLTQHLVCHRSRWSGCQFSQIRSGSPLLEIHAPDGCNTQLLQQEEPCPALTFSSDSMHLRDHLPPGIFKKVEYYRRRLDKAGPWSVVIANEETFPELFDALIVNHQARRAARGQTGIFSDPQTCSFHRKAAGRLLAFGRLRLYGLVLRGKIAASLYAFSEQKTTFYYGSGFDPELSSLELGTILISAAIQQALREGNQVFDFLRGNEPYKYRWGAKDEVTFVVGITKSTPNDD
jgi:CelD/BcsL family acetyltransferase involved in cellulose biosynthesis